MGAVAHWMRLCISIIGIMSSLYPPSVAALDPAPLWPGDKSAINLSCVPVEVVSCLSTPLQFRLASFVIVQRAYNRPLSYIIPRPSSFILSMAWNLLLLRAGDVEANPGPSTPVVEHGLLSSSSQMRSDEEIALADIIRQSVTTSAENEKRYEEEIATLRGNLEPLNFSISEPFMKRDGACFFSAMIDQLKILKLDSPYPDALSLRLAAVQFVRDNPNLQMADDMADLSAQVEDGFEHYCDRMEKPGEYADQTIQTATAWLLECNLKIFPTVSMSRETFVSISHPNHRHTFHIGFLSCVKHYESLISRPVTPSQPLQEQNPGVYRSTMPPPSHLSSSVKAGPTVESLGPDMDCDRLPRSPPPLSNDDIFDGCILENVQGHDDDKVEALLEIEKILSTSNKLHAHLENMGKQVTSELTELSEVILEEVAGNPLWVPAEDLEKAYIEDVRRVTKSQKDVTFDFQYISADTPSDEIDLIEQSLLLDLKSKGLGNYTKKVSRGKGKKQFRCARNGHQENKPSTLHVWDQDKPREKRKDATAADPTVSPCNKCDAYVSFSTELVDVNYPGKGSVLVTRMSLTHTGHNPKNPEEGRVSKIAPQVLEKIEAMHQLKAKPADIIAAIAKDNKEAGRKDGRDREYFPELADVTAICARLRRKTRLSPNDAVAVDLLCTQPDLLKDKIAFYQPRDVAASKGLIVVYQNEEQLERAAGASMCFMDATYKGVTAYGFALYVIVVRDPVSGRGTPICYIILSIDDGDNLAIALENLKRHMEIKGVTFQPSVFMIDRDMKEMNAIRDVFPHAHQILCFFHVLQAIYRWMNALKSGVGGDSNVEKRRSIIQFLRAAKLATSEKGFNEIWAKGIKSVPKKVRAYLNKEWKPRAKMWAEFGPGRRMFHEGHDTNNMAERFFLALKYQFLGGYGNRRLDDLLILIDGAVSTFYDYQQMLASVGRGITKKSTAHLGKKKADILLKAGWADKTTIIDSTHGVYLVPSATSGKAYKVDLARLTCDCVAASMEGLCKHLHVARHVASLRSADTETTARQLIANGLHADESYFSDWEHVHVYDDNVVTVISRDTGRCYCIAASHGVKCICSFLNDRLTENTAPTPSSVSCDSHTPSVSNDPEPQHSDSPGLQPSPDDPAHSDPLDPNAVDRILFFRQLDKFKLQMEADAVLDPQIVRQARELFSLKNSCFGAIPHFRQKQQTTSANPSRISKRKPLIKSSAKQPSLPSRIKSVPKKSTPKNPDGGPKRSRTRSKATPWDDITPSDINSNTSSHRSKPVKRAAPVLDTVEAPPTKKTINKHLSKYLESHGNKEATALNAQAGPSLDSVNVSLAQFRHDTNSSDKPDSTLNSTLTSTSTANRTAEALHIKLPTLNRNMLLSALGKEQGNSHLKKQSN